MYQFHKTHTIYLFSGEVTMFDALVFLGGQLGLGLLVLLQLNWYSVILGNVSWVMEFLTFGYKISLILSKRLMDFKKIAVFCELK